MPPELTAADGGAGPALADATSTATAPAPVTAVRPATADHPSASPVRRPGAWLVRPLVIFAVARALTWATLIVCAAVTHRSLARVVNRWDSRWFIRAAVGGWPSHLPHVDGHVAASTVAFFPVYPLAVRWLGDLTGLSPLASGLTVTTVTGLTATVGVWMLVRHYDDQAAADRATLLVAVFPGAFVLSLAYSEGITVTCVAFGLLALLTRRWVVAGILGLVATATIPIALAFEVSCLWCAYRAVVGRRNWRALAAPVLTPLGFVAYQVWLWQHTGNLRAWELTERGGWKSYASFGYALDTVGHMLRDPVANNKTGFLLFGGMVVAGLGTVVAIRQKMPWPMVLYGVTAALAASVAAPVGLRPRFVFIAFPLIIAIGIWLRGRVYAAAVTISIVALIALTAYEVCSWAIFP